MTVWMPSARRPREYSIDSMDHRDHMVPTRIPFGEVHAGTARRAAGAFPRLSPQAVSAIVCLAVPSGTQAPARRRTTDLLPQIQSSPRKSGQFSVWTLVARSHACTSPPIFEMGQTRASRKNHGEAFCWPGQSSRATKSQERSSFPMCRAPKAEKMERPSSRPWHFDRKDFERETPFSGDSATRKKPVWTWPLCRKRQARILGRCGGETAPRFGNRHARMGAGHARFV